MASGPWTPAVDISEAPEASIIRAEVPGSGRQALSVELKDSRLIVEGERRFEGAEGHTYRRVERAHGACRRVFSLSPTVWREQSEAILQGGALEITPSKAARSRPSAAAWRVADGGGAAYRRRFWRTATDGGRRGAWELRSNLWRPDRR
jgi:HSP20 family protein